MEKGRRLRPQLGIGDITRHHSEIGAIALTWLACLWYNARFDLHHDRPATPGEREPHLGPIARRPGSVH